jgi:hypothetical protein
MENIKSEINMLEIKLSDILKELSGLDNSLIMNAEIISKKAEYEKQLKEISDNIYNLKNILKIPVINKINSLSDEEIIKLCEDRKEVISEKLAKVSDSKNAISLNQDDLDISLSVAIQNYGTFNNMPRTFYDGISTYLNKDNMNYIRTAFYSKLPEEIKQGLEYLAIIKNKIDDQISVMRSNGISFKEEDIINCVMNMPDAIYGTNRNFVEKFSDTFHKSSSMGYGLNCILENQRLTKIATDLNIDLSQMPVVDLSDVKNYSADTIVDGYNFKLQNLINTAYKEKKQQHDAFESEEKHLNNQILKLEEWKKNPNLFRSQLKDKFGVSGYEKSSEFKELKTASQADQELTNLSDKRGLDAKSMSPENFTSLLDTAKTIEIINNEIAKLNKDDSDINVISQRLSGLEASDTFGPSKKMTNDLTEKSKEQDSIIEDLKHANGSLEKEKTILEGKTIVFGKAKKISELDSKIGDNNSKITIANNAKNNFINEMSNIKNKMVTQVIDVIRSDCKIFTIAGMDIEKYIKEITYSANVNNIIDVINEKLFIEQNNIKANIRSRQEQVNSLKGNVNNLTLDEANKISKNREVLASNNQVPMVGYYNQVNSFQADTDELSHLKENFDEILENTGRKL